MSQRSKSEIGKLGGKKGGPARARAMTAKERSESARNAMNARWAKVPAKERSEYARRMVRARWDKQKSA